MYPESNIDVSGGQSSPPPSVSPMGDAAPSSSAPETTNQTPATPQSGVPAQPETAQIATVTDPLEGLPTVDELRTQAEQRVPYAQGLLNVRSAYEALRPEHETLQRQFEAWKPITEKFNDPSQLDHYVQLGQGLFANRTERDPVTGQEKVVYDQETGLPQQTTRPFIDNLEAQSPGTADQLLGDLLHGEAEYDGIRAPRLEHLFRYYGLDINRVQEYQQIDKRPSYGSGGVIAPEELESVPKQYHEVYKGLSQEARDAVQLMDPITKEDYLTDRQDALESRKFKEEQRAEKEEGARRQEQAVQQQIQSEGWQNISKSKADAVNSLVSNIKSQLKFSTDEGVNDLYAGLIVGNLVNLLDPMQRGATEGWLKNLGVTIGPDFDQNLNTFTTATMMATNYERRGDNFKASQQKKDASDALQRLMAKANGYVAPVIARLNEVNKASLQAQNGQLETAQNGRPVINGLAGENLQTSNLPMPLPKGVMPLSQEANEWYAKNASLRQ